jgi:hypothetical protein
VEAKFIVSVRDRLIGVALKYLTFLEPFAKFGISYYLNRRLKQYEQQGLLAEYKTRVQRRGKWHYRIEVSLDLTSTQVGRVLRVIVQQIRGLGR